MHNLLANLMGEFRRYKVLADRAIAQVDDQDFVRRPAAQVNPVALVVKHLGGNLVSRWTDFLTTDGEKPSRDRDGEFLLTEQDTRDNLLAAWERGWKVLFDTLESLGDSDLEKTVTIRGESHAVLEALLRGLTHVAYHTGQILYLVRVWRPESPWLTIAPGQSRKAPGAYLRSR